MRRLAGAVGVRPGEGRTAGLLFSLTLLLAAGGTMGSSAVDALLFARFGVRPLPYLYAGLGVLNLLSALGVTAVLARGNRGRFYVWLAAGLVGGQVVEWLAAGAGVAALLPAAWLFMNLMSNLQGMIGWGLAGLVCDTRQAKRLFPLFGSGGVLGSVLGGLATRPLAAVAGAENLIAAWAVLTAAAFLLGLVLLRRVPREAPRPPGAGFIREARQGLDITRRTPMLAWLLAASVLFSVLYYVLAFAFSRGAAQAYHDPGQLAGFLGLFSATATGAAFLVGVFLAARIYARIGLMSSIVVFPLIYLAGFALLAFLPGLPELVVVRFAQTVWLYAVAGSAYHAAMNVIPSERRDQARAFIDGLGTQVGTILGGLALAAGQLALDIRLIHVFGAVIAAVTGFATWRAARAYPAALLGALRRGQPVIFGGAADRAFEREAAATLIAAGSLVDPSPAVRRLAAETVAAAGMKDPLEPLLGDTDPGVRAAAAAGLERTDVLAQLIDSGGDDRALALDAGRRADLPGAAALGLRHLADPSPRVRRAAVAAAATAEPGSEAMAQLLAALDDPDRSDAAVAALQRSRGVDGHPGPRRLAERESARALDLAASWVEVEEPAARLLAESVRNRARRHALRALRAMALPGDERLAAAATALESSSPEQRANGIEMVESSAPALARPLLALFEEGGRPGPPEGWPASLVEDPDPWLGELSALVAARDYPAGGLIDRLLFLRRVGLFTGLDPADLRELAAVAAQRSFAAGAELARQGDPGDRLFVIQSGRVRVLVDGKEIAVRGPGEHVGEMAIVTGEPRAASLVAEGEVEVLELEKEQFETVLRERPEVAMAVIAALAARLRERS